ncbi:MAG: hypothetical protein RLZZ232_1256 [Planctomycetota bacterium]
MIAAADQKGAGPVMEGLQRASQPAGRLQTSSDNRPAVAPLSVPIPDNTQQRRISTVIALQNQDCDLRSSCAACCD